MTNHYEDFYYSNRDDEKREKSEEIRNKLKEITDLILSFSLKDLGEISGKNLQQVFELENMSLFTSNFSMPEINRIKDLLYHDPARWSYSEKLCNNLYLCEEFRKYDNWKRYTTIKEEVFTLIEDYPG